MTVEGYLYDVLCLNSPRGVAPDGSKVKTEAHKHTVMCLLLPQCVKSGFVLVRRSANGTYVPTHKLSSRSTPKIVAFLKALTREDNVYVKITGTIDSWGAIAVRTISDALTQTVEGYLYDVLCLNSPSGIATDGTMVKTEAHKHSVKCLLLPQCVKSGFVLVKRSGANGTYVPTHKLSSRSTPKIVAFLKALTREDNVYVKITGTIDSWGAIAVRTVADAFVPPKARKRLLSLPAFGGDRGVAH